MDELMPPTAEGTVADHGVATSMTVVVKAANQKYNDQTVECQGSWTVKKLKAHLSEVYPCKPRENQQKIIFSGRLLQDHLLLKDVLRSFDPDCPTTVHLVCSPSLDATKETQSSTTNVTSTPASTVTAESSVRRRTIATTAPSQTTVPSPAQTLPNPTAHPYTVQYPTNMSPEAYNAWIERYREHYSSYMQQYQSMGLNNHADNYNYQQYWQQYMQYMQAYQSGMMMHMSHIPASPQPVTETQPVPEPAPAGGNGEAAGAGAAPMNAGGGGAMFENDEEDGRNRDWLDWLYLTSRLGVFLSIMYFYSTVGRLTLVFGFFVLILILRNRLYAPRVNNNDRNQRNNNLVNEEDRANNNVAPAPDGRVVAPEAPAPAMAEQPVEGEQGNAGTGDQVPPPQPARPSAWNIFIQFFSSLVPQPPPAN